MKTLSVFLLLFVMPGLSSLRAQEVISSSGNHSAGSGVALSWTVGEPVIGTVSNGSVTLTQGFHQSRLSTTSVDEIVTPGLKLAVYPNPFSEILNLKVDEGEFSKLQYALFTLEGKSLALQNLRDNLTQIDLQTYAAGNYLLKVTRKNGAPVKTFKNR